MKPLFVAAALTLGTAALADIAPPPEPKPLAAEPAPAPVAPAPAPIAVHPEGIEKVPMGVIEGGWAYVYACYGLAIGGTFLYGLSLFLRRPSSPPPGAAP